MGEYLEDPFSQEDPLEQFFRVFLPGIAIDVVRNIKKNTAVFAEEEELRQEVEKIVETKFSELSIGNQLTSELPEETIEESVAEIKGQLIDRVFQEVFVSDGKYTYNKLKTSLNRVFFSVFIRHCAGLLLICMLFLLLSEVDNYVRFFWLIVVCGMLLRSFPIEYQRQIRLLEDALRPGPIAPKTPEKELKIVRQKAKERMRLWNLLFVAFGIAAFAGAMCAVKESHGFLIGLGVGIGGFLGINVVGKWVTRRVSLEEQMRLIYKPKTALMLMCFRAVMWFLFLYVFGFWITAFLIHLLLKN